jgi:predicted DNA-binding transcriptional regulator YafY
LREQAQHLAQRFHLDAPAWFSKEDDAEHLADVARAVWEQHRSRVTYQRGDTTVERLLDPLGLVLKAGVWYLVARADSEAVRTYRVSRIQAVEDTGERFDRPTDFDLATWWERSSARFERTMQRIRVRVRLSRLGTRFLGTVLDPHLAAEALAAAGPPDADGWVDVELGLEDPAIAAEQLLGLGAEIEIVDPPAVRAAFADIARRMVDRHR